MEHHVVILLWLSLQVLMCSGVQQNADYFFCPGESETLICSTNHTFLEWSISTLRRETRSIDRDIPYLDQNVFVPPIIVDSAKFTFSRVSSPGALPLVSNMTIMNITRNLEGTVISCTGLNSSSVSSVVLMTTIHVYDMDVDFPNAPEVVLRPDMIHFGSDNFSATLEWSQYNDHETYSVTIVPEPGLHTGHNTTTSIQLVLLYNTQYNVIITANLCGYSNATKVTIHYTVCGVPVSNAKLNYTSVREGSALILTCENDTSTDGEILRLSTTCHSNGSWIPDPTQFSCSSFITTAPSGTEHFDHSSFNNSSGSSADQSLGVIIGSVLGVLMIAATAAVLIILCLIKKGLLHPKRVNRSLDIQLGNTYHPYAEQNSSEHPDPVQQDHTLVYADIGPSSVKKRAKQVVTLRPDDTDDRVEYAVLNHRLQKPIIITNQDSRADDSLNLDTLLIQVRGAVTPHWYQLGQALKVSKDVLDKCTNYPPEESIVEVLDQWLRNFPGCPTWRDVAYALRGIGLQQLANDIEMVYETGKLPIAVDDNDAGQVFTTAPKLPQQEKETETTFNSCQDQDESVPPLPPKPLSGSAVPRKMLAPPRPPKYVAK